MLTGDHGLHAILDVVFDGQKTPHHAVLKEYQLDPTRPRLLHIDLHEVRLDQVIQTQVAVEPFGESPGVKEGGALTLVLREINVEALPMEVPDRLELDISGMTIGDCLRVADVIVPEGVEVLDDPEAVRRDSPATDQGRGARDRGGRGGSRARRASRARPRARKVRRRPRARPRATAAKSPPRARTSPCVSSVGASRPRRSTCSWRGSATRAANTPARVTTSGTWSRTSWPAGRAGRFAPSSRASSPRFGSTARASPF